MNDLKNTINKYLDFCQYQKCLDKKTLKAYKIDLKQFFDSILKLSIILDTFYLMLYNKT